MVPVVDGLEAKYQDQVEFRRIDANSPTGISAYQVYALRGHPGFVLLSPDGSTFWKGIGEQPVENLEEPILSLIGTLIEKGVLEYNSFIEEVGSLGIPIEIGGSVSQPFFTSQGQIVILYGEEVQVFEYGSEEEAHNEEKLVSADGSSVGTTMITWVDTPHFYQAGKIIVLYVGKNTQVIDTLNELLGNQFAGG
jgi:hypothetical protein